MHSSDEKSKMVVSFSDLWMVICRSKKRIAQGAILCSLLAVTYAVTRPVEYESKATFREQSKSQSGLSNNSLSSILTLGNVSNNASEAISLMKSRTIIEQLIKKEGLQASIEKKEIRFPLLARVRDNLLTEYALVTKRMEPILPETPAPLIVRDVNFDGESPLLLQIRVVSDEMYQIVDRDGTSIIVSFGEPAVFKNVHFVLNKNIPDVKTFSEYTLKLIPMHYAAQYTLDKLNVEYEKDNKFLVKLRFACGQRQHSMACLNALMDIYQDYTKKDQGRILQEQIDYLQTRQDSMQDKLQKMMEVHATTITSDAISTGFLDSKGAMEFFGANLQRYTQSLISIDLELRQLINSQNGGVTNYESLSTVSAIDTEKLSPILRALEDIRKRKYEADILDMALREADTNHEIAVKDFSDQTDNFEKIQHFTDEAEKILSGLDRGILPDSQLDLYNNPKYMVKEWSEKLKTIPKNSQEWKNGIANFSLYINNLIHLFQIHSKAIVDRITHQQGSHVEFQGIDLRAAQGLYLDYTRELKSVESALRENEFLINKMQEADFEISSLSTLLKDNITQKMIDKAATAALALEDSNNRSSKEQDRLKNELEVQKGFLKNHLEQVSQLNLIQISLLKDKIRTLQSAILGLTQQEISVLQDHLADYVQSRKENLEQARETIIQQQRELQQEMTRWPSQWVSEMLIEQQMEINKQMVEEVTKLVEAKNISSNLEVIRSAPIDRANIPPHAKSPRIILLAILGAFFGAFVPFAWAMIQTMSKGFPVSSENLKGSGYAFAGNLASTYGKNDYKPLLDQDLETLRHISTFLESSNTTNVNSRAAVLFTGQGPDYSKELARLLSKTGLKVLLMSVSFNNLPSESQLPGLIQYLEDPSIAPKVSKMDGYDEIAAGGISRFSAEYLASQPFAVLLQNLMKQYQRVIAISDVPIDSAEATVLLKLFPFAAVTIFDQHWPDLANCLNANSEIIYLTSH